jgi:hypothetical protein
VIVARTSSIQVFSQTDENGAALLDRVGAEVLVLTLRGDIGDDWANAIVGAMSDELRSGAQTNFFADIEHLESYGPLLRQRATDTLLRHRRWVASIHALVRSRVVSMGVSIANVALGGMIVTYASRRSFESAIEAALLGDSGALLRSKAQARVKR